MKLKALIRRLSGPIVLTDPNPTYSILDRWDGLTGHQSPPSSLGDEQQTPVDGSDITRRSD